VHICMVSSSYPPPHVGGIAQVVAALRRHLITRGHKVSVVTCGDPSLEETDVHRVCQSPMAFPVRAPHTAVSLLLQSDVDVWHFHDYASATVAKALRKVAKRRGLDHPRIVSTLAVSALAEYRSVRPLRLNGQILQRPSAQEYGFKLRCLLHHWGAKVMVRVSDLIVALGKAAAAELQADCGACADKIVEIPNGVDTSRFRTREGPPPAAFSELRQSCDVVALYVGRFRTVKGLPYLLHGLRRARDEGASLGLILLGDGPLEAALRSQINALGLNGCARIVPPVRNEAMASHYNSADFVVLASIHEGLPLVILEAMSCGKPVVAPRVSCIPDAVADGETGLLFDVGDVGGLTRALCTLSGDASLRQRMGEAARHRAHSVFDWHAITEQYETVYRSLLN